MTTITALPTPPNRGDSVGFAAAADTFVAALPQFVSQVNALAGELNALVVGGTQIGVATSQEEEDALFAAGYVFVYRSDLLTTTTTTTAAPTTAAPTTTTTAAPTTAAPTTTTTAAPTTTTAAPTTTTAAPTTTTTAAPSLTFADDFPIFDPALWSVIDRGTNGASAGISVVGGRLRMVAQGVSPGTVYAHKELQMVDSANVPISLATIKRISFDFTYPDTSSFATFMLAIYDVHPAGVDFASALSKFFYLGVTGPAGEMVFIYKNGGAESFASPVVSSGMTAGNTYAMAIDVQVSAGQIVAAVYINGVLKVTTNAVPAGFAMAEFFAGLAFGATSMTASTCYVDNLLIATP